MQSPCLSLSEGHKVSRWSCSDGCDIVGDGFMTIWRGSLIVDFARRLSLTRQCSCEGGPIRSGNNTPAEMCLDRPGVVRRDICWTDAVKDGGRLFAMTLVRVLSYSGCDSSEYGMARAPAVA